MIDDWPFKIPIKIYINGSDVFEMELTCDEVFEVLLFLYENFK